ncbi:hypothetical protein BGZ63DRAFT_388280 [Mariannaea sp. PMI_226]|nr:hypothetical protein BGZ63DRAFT_388280 [Mariannaea sp. PMI_226]
MKHICFRTQCGICGRAFLTGVSFNTLLRSDTQPQSILCLSREVFPDKLNSVSFDDYLLCWLPNCWRCARSPEAVGIHSDCFKLFKQVCDISDDELDRLWIVALFRSPWRGAPNLGLYHDTGLAVDLVYEKAAPLGISRLGSLPPELIRLIRDFSPSSTFWRYICAVSFAMELSTVTRAVNTLSASTITPLSVISSWSRGTEPTFSTSPDRPSIMMLTIDRRGIKLIERLPHRPSYQQWRSDNVAFAIQEESQLGNVMVQLKYGILRLELVRHDRGFHIWDMPNPPRLNDCRFSGHVAQSTRFRTIDLRGTTGLTFFFSFNKVYAVHAHTPRIPEANDTFSQLSQRRQVNVAWIYLPIPKEDEIIALTVRLRRSQGRSTAQKPCFLVRTRLAGDVFLGPCHMGEHEDIILSKSRPRMLIYNTVDIGPATVFGTYQYDLDRNDDDHLPQFHYPVFDSVPIHQANLSLAPLKGVTRIQTFTDTELGFCKAIIFDYENGAQRAVGNCRLGIDCVTDYLNPSRICYLPVSFVLGHSGGDRQLVRVEGGCDDFAHNHDEVSWVCSGMDGVLEFWFSEEESVINIGTQNET